MNVHEILTAIDDEIQRLQQARNLLAAEAPGSAGAIIRTRSAWRQTTTDVSGSTSKDRRGTAAAVGKTKEERLAGV